MYYSVYSLYSQIGGRPYGAFVFDLSILCWALMPTTYYMIYDSLHIGLWMFVIVHLVFFQLCFTITVLGSEHVATTEFQTPAQHVTEFTGKHDSRERRRISATRRSLKNVIPASLKRPSWMLAQNESAFIICCIYIQNDTNNNYNDVVVVKPINYCM